MELRDGLLGAMKYEDALSWLFKDCGVSSSMASLSSFYRRHCAPVQRDRRRLFAIKAEEFEKAEEEDGLDFTDSAFARLKQRYFEMVLDPLADLKEVETMAKMLLDYGKLQLATEKVEQDNRRLQMLEEKAGRIDALESIGKEAGLTEDQMREKALAMVDEMLGLKAPKKK